MMGVLTHFVSLIRGESVQNLTTYPSWESTYNQNCIMVQQWALMCMRFTRSRAVAEKADRTALEILGLK